MAAEISESAETKGGLIYQGTYAEYKSALDTEIRKTAEGFIKIGYLLKIARDTSILFESGYGSVAEFAQAEYGLTKDVVSRYIAINDKYSENGYSDQLQERFRGFGVAKLAEMLTLPDAVIASMNPQLTKSQIREVKEEVRQELEITPLEVAMEPQEDGVQGQTPLQQFLFQYFREKPFQFREIHRHTMGNTDLSDNKKWIELALDVMCPSGNGCESVRIPGRGRLLLFFHGRQNDLKLVIVRENTRQEVGWSSLREAVLRMCVKHEEAEKAWEQIYHESFPEEPAAETPEPEVPHAEKRVEQPKRKENGKDAPAQLKKKQEGAEDAKGESDHTHTGSEDAGPAVKEDKQGQEDFRQVEETPEGGINPPEVIPEEETEVEYDFWAARRMVQEGIRELSKMLLASDWNGLEKKLAAMLDTVRGMRSEVTEG